MGSQSTNEEMWQVIIGGRKASGRISCRLPACGAPRAGGVLPPQCADPELERIFEEIAHCAKRKPYPDEIKPATHCKYGHEYAVVGVYQYVGKAPACIECRKVYRRKWWAVRKLLADAPTDVVSILRKVWEAKP